MRHETYEKLLKGLIKAKLTAQEILELKGEDFKEICQDERLWKSIYKRQYAALACPVEATLSYQARVRIEALTEEIASGSSADLKNSIRLRLYCLVSKGDLSLLDQLVTKARDLNDPSQFNALLLEQGPLSLHLQSIEDFIQYIGVECPARQPRDEEEWAFYTDVPKRIKAQLIHLLPVTDCAIITCLRSQARPSENLPEIEQWLRSFQDLFTSLTQPPAILSATDTPKFFKALYDFTAKTDLTYAANVMSQLSEKRFNSTKARHLLSQLHQRFTPKAPRWDEPVYYGSQEIREDVTSVKDGRYLPLLRSRSNSLTSTPSSSQPEQAPLALSDISGSPRL